MAVAIAYALQASPLVLFSMTVVGAAANALGGAGGPLAVFFMAIAATEAGKLVSRKTKVDIIVTPLVTIGVGVGLSQLLAPAIGSAAISIGELIMWATEQQPFVMGIVVSVVMGICLTLPISSAAICAALGTDRTCRWCCRGRMLCADGWFCFCKFQGKPLEWYTVTRHRHKYAADGQHC